MDTTVECQVSVQFNATESTTEPPSNNSASVTRLLLRSDIYNSEEQHTHTPYKQVHSNSMRKDPTPNMQYVCPVCDKTYKTKASLSVHHNLHSNAKTFACDQCSKTFLRRSSLFNHTKLHKYKENRFKCTVCDEILLSEAALTLHETSHTDEKGFNNYEVPCCVCGAILSTKVGLKLHITQMHPEVTQGNHEKNHQCEFCSKKFANSTYLKQHMKTHTDTKSHRCTQCDYKALTREAIRRHIDRIHLKLRKYECSICNKKFVSQPDRKLHMLRHYKTKPVQCDLCDQRFYSTRELRRHKWAHSGKKPFRCEDCAVAYAYMESYKNHLSTHLSQPLPCSKCNRKFWSKKVLSKHLRDHPSSDNIFKCFDCGKFYKTFGHLQKHHAKFNHSACIFVCHPCNLEFSAVDKFDAHNSYMCHTVRGLQSLVDNKVQSKNSSVFHKNCKKMVTIVSINNLWNELTKLEKKFSREASNGINSFRNSNSCDSNIDNGNTDIKAENIAYDTDEDYEFPIECVELTDVDDVFKCEPCDKLFVSITDHAEHCRHFHDRDAASRIVQCSSNCIEVLDDTAIADSEHCTDSVELTLAC